jgi:hypothetical protein
LRNNKSSKFAIINAGSVGLVKSSHKEINHYLDHLSTQQKKVVLNVVKTFACEEEDWWDDESFVKEMDKRVEELESGKDKGLSWEEVKLRARRSAKNNTPKL